VKRLAEKKVKPLCREALQARHCAGNRASPSMTVEWPWCLRRVCNRLSFLAPKYAVAYMLTLAYQAR
jgi:hypothetical protein